MTINKMDLNHKLVQRKKVKFESTNMFKSINNKNQINELRPFSSFDSKL